MKGPKAANQRRRRFHARLSEKKEEGKHGISKTPQGILRTTHCARSTIARLRLRGALPVISSQRDGKHPKAADSHATARAGRKTALK